MVNRAVPTEVKRRRGTLRPDRVPGDLVPVGRVSLDVPPPASLKGVGQVAWRQILQNTTWIARSDLTALQTVCELIDRHSRLLKKFETEDELLYTSTGYAYSNPLIVALDKVEAQLAKWMSLLGLTPSDRSRLGVAEVAQASTLEKLAARRAARGATSPASGRPQDESTPTAGDTD